MLVKKSKSLVEGLDTREVYSLVSSLSMFYGLSTDRLDNPILAGYRNLYREILLNKNFKNVSSFEYLIYFISAYINNDAKNFDYSNFEEMCIALSKDLRIGISKSGLNEFIDYIKDWYADSSKFWQGKALPIKSNTSCRFFPATPIVDMLGNDKLAISSNKIFNSKDGIFWSGSDDWTANGFTSSYKYNCLNSAPGNTVIPLKILIGCDDGHVLGTDNYVDWYELNNYGITDNLTGTLYYLDSSANHQYGFLTGTEYIVTYSKYFEFTRRAINGNSATIVGLDCSSKYSYRRVFACSDGKIGYLERLSSWSDVPTYVENTVVAKPNSIIKFADYLYITGEDGTIAKLNSDMTLSKIEQSIFTGKINDYSVINNNCYLVGAGGKMAVLSESDKISAINTGITDDILHIKKTPNGFMLSTQIQNLLCNTYGSAFSPSQYAYSNRRIFSDGKYFYSGDGAFCISNDGLDFVKIHKSYNIINFANGNDKYLANAVESSTACNIITSSDGTAWSVANSHSYVSDLKFFKDKFYIIESSNALKSSPNGNQWTSVKSGTNLSKIIPFDDKCMICTQTSGTSLFYTTDGTTISTISSNIKISDAVIGKKGTVYYHFYAIADDGKIYEIRSTDGTLPSSITWTDSTYDPTDGYNFKLIKNVVINDVSWLIMVEYNIVSNRFNVHIEPEDDIIAGEPFTRQKILSDSTLTGEPTTIAYANGYIAIGTLNGLYSLPFALEYSHV